MLFSFFFAFFLKLGFFFLKVQYEDELSNFLQCAAQPSPWRAQHPHHHSSSRSLRGPDVYEARKTQLRNSKEVS